jgi:phosphatidate cytidylyltransferase
MADDDRSGGFDDWLEEEPGPVTDPYATLAEDDDAEAEISDWMAFTHGDTADDDASHGTDAASPARETSASGPTDDTEPSGSTAEIDAVDASDGGPGAGAHDDDATEEIAIVRSDPTGGEDLDAISQIPIIRPTDVPHTPATTVDLDEFDGGARADTDEIPIIAGADVVAASVTNLADRTDHPTGADDPEPGEGDAGSSSGDATGEHPEDTGELPIDDDLDDTGELDVIEDDATDDLVAEDDTLDAFTAAAPAPEEGDGRPGDDDDRPEFFDLTNEDYLGVAATSDHAGLAAAIAQADSEATEPVALSAPMAGLEETVVGFDDVVQAEGHGKVRARRSGDLAARVITAVVLIALFALSLVWRPALVGLALAVFIVGAGEFYTALSRSGRHPIALFGFVGILGATLGGFVWGAIAIPMSFFVVTTLMLLFYAVVPGRVDPLGNLTLTLAIMAWVGLGSFAMLIAVSDDYRPLVIGVVVAVAAMDMAQYFVGRSLGRHQLSPWVSPKKTVEGLVGGVIVAFTVGALLHFFPPFELTSGLAIGAATALLVPLGDLAMSAAKRSLGLKDMGSILPGHGGFLDRIDGLLFVIPAAWAIFVWGGLL